MEEQKNLTTEEVKEVSGGNECIPQMKKTCPIAERRISQEPSTGAGRFLLINDHEPEHEF